jgi:hypothetical protein
MQWAPQFVTHDEAFGKRSAVVGTMRSNREELIAAASNDYIFITELSLNHPAIRNLGARNSTVEIQSRRVFHIFVTFEGVTEILPSPQKKLSLHP